MTEFWVRGHECYLKIRDVCLKTHLTGLRQSYSQCEEYVIMLIGHIWATITREFRTSSQPSVSGLGSNPASMRRNPASRTGPGKPGIKWNQWLQTKKTYKRRRQRGCHAQSLDGPHRKHSTGWHLKRDTWGFKFVRTDAEQWYEPSWSRKSDNRLFLLDLRRSSVKDCASEAILCKSLLMDSSFVVVPSDLSFVLVLIRSSWIYGGKH